MTGKNLKELREQLGLTQAQLATRLGVSVTTVSRWECGRHMISDLVAGGIMRKLWA